MNQRLVHSLLLSSALLATLTPAVRADETKLQVQKATGKIELTDPAGDVQPIHSSSRDYPGLDVVSLTIASDGKQIAFTATLADPPGSFATEVLSVYFDTDNKQTTGMQMTYPELGGFEYKAELQACADYSDKSSACVGGSEKGKLTRHWAAVNLVRYKGKGAYDTDTVVDSMGFPGSKASAQEPIPGKIMQGSIDYADLKVKPGQTIRILVSEACAGGNLDSYFPEILLKLQ
ncbi:MAG TPA: hypothetical protein VIC28_15435 [Thermoanaerobaculia bacterium]